MSDAVRRRSLHARLARWMAASAIGTLALYAALLFVFFALEKPDQPGAAHGNEESLVETASEQMLYASLIAAPIAIAAAIGGSLWLSRRALAPLDSVIAGARAVTASNLRQRLALPAVRDELFDLTAEMNGLLARLDEGFAALARYAGDASHELRTPIAVVVSELEVALRHPRSAGEWEQTAATVLSELRRLSRLVESLLALARADGPLEQATAFDLREQVDLILASLSERAKARGIELSSVTEGDSGDARTTGDPDAIASAVRNVVENALRYTPSGGHARVALHVAPTYLEITVDDSGPGIPVAERESIFVPLRRGSAVAADGEVGHGLGLALARRLIERHGGTIAVSESPAGGARFVIRLPHEVVANAVH